MLTPDELHTKCFQGHTEPSSETLKLLGELERRMTEKLETKVGKNTFWTVITLVIGISTSVMGVAFWLAWGSMQDLRVEIKDVNNKTTEVKATVSNIEGKLQPFEFILNDK